MVGELATPVSGEQESSLRLWNRAAEFAGGFDPFLHYDFHVLESFQAGIAVRGAPGQLRDFRDKRVVLGAPVEDDLVFRHWIPPATLYRTTIARTCLTWYGFASEPRGCKFRIS